MCQIVVGHTSYMVLVLHRSINMPIILERLKGNYKHRLDLHFFVLFKGEEQRGSYTCVYRWPE